MNLFVPYIFLISLISMITSYDYDSLVDSEILTNLSISSFLDENRYIRLNISWSNVTDAVNQISIRFVEDIEDENADNCGIIDSVDRISVAQQNSIIIPSLTLSNPADELLNGCVYKTVVETHDLNPNLKQTMMYQIPECVQDKCKCKETSPYQLSSIIPLREDNYFLKWDKHSHENLTLISIYCTRISNNSSNQTRTSVIKVHQTNVTKDGARILLPDIKEEVNYRVTATFHHDGCAYRSSITLRVSAAKSALSTIIGLILLVLVLLLLLLVMLIRSKKCKSIVQKYTNCVICRSYEESEDVHAKKLLTISFKKEEINRHYMPTEFYLNAHKFDKYEFPRNRLIISPVQMGEGNFGTVHVGEAFEINNNPGYTKVAVKQLKGNAGNDEKQELLKEIEILKKVGEHKNVVRLLGCVTIDPPFMIILELVAGGSLKDYLLKLREKWSKRKSRIFFADDMCENWNPNKQIDSKKMKYTKLMFDSSDTSCITTNDTSYITPNEICKEDLKEHEVVNMDYLSTYWKPSSKERPSSDISQGPQSPISIVSSGLISCADTEVTTLPSLPTTPEIQVMNNGYVQRVEPLLDNEELERFALQIASGMQYLEQINVTHRDLAARNILMTSDKVLKISDFGLSRVGIYVSRPGQKLPLRWMAIESFEENTFTNKSDVWSYGVVLWEIGTLGGLPYGDIQNSFFMIELKRGKRLDRPQICTDELYKLMMKCWSEHPEDRPTFAEILNQLEGKTKKIYDDFDKLSPTYCFPVSQDSEST